MSFTRDTHGLEIDVLVEKATMILAIEAKSGATVAADAVIGLQKFAAGVSALRPRLHVDQALVYGGDDRFSLGGATVIPWRHVGELAR